jgi:hypothetical protein
MSNPVTSTMRLLGIAVLLALPGCASVSKTECQTGDWYDIGIRDGANGYGEERFLDNAKACAKHGLPADRERWSEGRLRGLERYCTARNGFAVGAQNSGYAGVCPREVEDEFLNGYSLGKDLAQARSRLAHYDHDIHEIHEKLGSHDDKNGSQDSKDGKPLTDAERVELAVRLGVDLAQREHAKRDVEELEARGREL